MSSAGKRALTPWEIAARRRNARKSTGPRTAVGKRRAPPNALRSGEHIRLPGGGRWFLPRDPKEFRHLHCDLLGPIEDWTLAFLANHLAQEFWWKWHRQRCHREMGLPDTSQRDDERIEEWLGSALEALATRSRKWYCRLTTSLGGGFDSLSELRSRLESRLAVYRTSIAHVDRPTVQEILAKIGDPLNEAK